MIDFIKFVVDNFNYFFWLGLYLIVSLVCFLLHNRTTNRGFIVILIGNLISAGWTSINVFFLQGVYFAQNLHNSGMATADINILLMVTGLIGLVVGGINALTLAIGLLMISNDLPSKYEAIN